MKFQSRELLVTTKVAQHWNDEFEQKVDELMDLVNKVDNDEQVQLSVEYLNVYHDSARKNQRGAGKKVRKIESDRPFEFVVFRN